MSNESKPPVPLALDASFLSPVDVVKPVPPAAAEVPAPLDVPVSSAPPPVATPAPKAGAAASTGAAGAHPSDGLPTLDLKFVPEKFHKHIDPNEAAPVRLMGAKAMVPMGAKDMVHVVYQCIFDPEPKIAQLAKRTFAKFDDRILDAVVSDATIAPPVLQLFARSLIKRPDKLEPVLLNRSTPDEAYVIVGEKVEAQESIALIAGNQERLLRSHDIVRAVSRNPVALRSDIDRAVDFLVRQGVFLEDVPAFEDAFLRLGKSEMLDAIKSIHLQTVKPTEKDIAQAEALGLTPEEYVDTHGGEASKGKIPLADRPWSDLTLPERLREASQGSHERALTGLQSQNRMVARAAVDNPKVKLGDIEKVLMKGQVADTVIREICKNRDWTKNYKVQLLLVQHPKTPTSRAMHWLSSLRSIDIKKLAKSKQVPAAVQAHAKKIMMRKNGRR